MHTTDLSEAGKILSGIQRALTGTRASQGIFTWQRPQGVAPVP
jgi:hypothetical protein